MKRLFCNERSKWLLGIGVVAIGAGVTAKYVISYPQQCMPHKTGEISQLVQDAGTRV